MGHVSVYRQIKEHSGLVGPFSTTCQLYRLLSSARQAAIICQAFCIVTIKTQGVPALAKNATWLGLGKYYTFKT